MVIMIYKNLEEHFLNLKIIDETSELVGQKNIKKIICDNHESISANSEEPAFIRKRTKEKQFIVKEKDFPELKAFLEVLNNSELLKNLEINKKNQLIEEFKEKFKEQISIRNKFFSSLPRPGSRTRLRNVLDRYVRGSSDDLVTISDLKDRLITDGYLKNLNSADDQGNIRYEETEKLKDVFGKKLINNSITERSLIELIKRSLDETDINTLNVKF